MNWRVLRLARCNALRNQVQSWLVRQLPWPLKMGMT